MDLESLHHVSDFITFTGDFLRFITLHLCNCVTKECLIKIKVGEDTVPAIPLLDNIVMSFAKTKGKGGVCNRINMGHELVGEFFGDDFKKHQLRHVDLLSMSNIMDLCGKDRHCMYIDYVIEKFIQYGLLNKREGKFYLLGTSRDLTWKNVMGLSSNDMKTMDSYIVRFLKERFDADPLLVVKCLFWYFRKFIVDSYLIFASTDPAYDTEGSNTFGLSVGSTLLTSDYDITLHGANKTVANIIYDFDNFVIGLFKNDSQIVFDTNLYGMSYILLQKRNDNRGLELSNRQVCKNQSFYYLKAKRDVVHSQHVWAFAKLLTNVYAVESLSYTHFKKFVNDIKYKKYLVWANYLTQNLKTTMTDAKGKSVYSKLILSYDRFVSYLQDAMSRGTRTPVTPKSPDSGDSTDSGEYSSGDRLSSIKDLLDDVSAANQLVYDDKMNTGIAKSIIDNNFVSLVNFYGNETYFTRGAFIDVVANTQFCGKRKIKQNTDEYLDSFIENISEMIVYPTKRKYLVRAERAINRTKYGGLVVSQLGMLKLQNKLENMIPIILECIAIVFNRYTSDLITRHPGVINEIDKDLAIFEHVIAALQLKTVDSGEFIHSRENLFTINSQLTDN